MKRLMLLCEPPRASIYRLPIGVRLRILLTVIVAHALVAWVYGMHMDQPLKKQQHQIEDPCPGRESE